MRSRAATPHVLRRTSTSIRARMARPACDTRSLTARGEVARLGHGVLGEARAALQVLLLRQPLEELVRREDELKRERDEDVADLPDLPVVARGDQELHRLASRRSRPSSSLVE